MIVHENAGADTIDGGDCEHKSVPAVFGVPTKALSIQEDSLFEATKFP